MQLLIFSIVLFSVTLGGISFLVYQNWRNDKKSSKGWVEKDCYFSIIFGITFWDGC